MARSSIRTSLPLDRYAKIIGFNPLWFNSAGISDGVTLQPGQGAANPYWYQYEWQSASLISREQLAREIALAEEQISNYLGYWVAPKFFLEEVRSYPKHYRRGYELLPMPNEIGLLYGKINAVGKRALSLIGTATVSGGDLVYSNDKSTKFYDLATITISTTVTDVNQIKLFFAGKSGDPTWEIRPIESISISGGVATIKLPSYLLIDPDLHEAYPDGQSQASVIAIGNNSNNFVSSVDVYREYIDESISPITFYWKKDETTTSFGCTVCNGNGCEVCTYITQDGCGIPANPEFGSIRVYPATYDATNERWNKSSFTIKRNPDFIKIWYQAGLYSQDYLSGYSLDPMDKNIEKAIAVLASARLRCNPKENNNIMKRVERYQRETTENIEKGSFFFNPEEIGQSPFGTKIGEVEAFRYLKHFKRGVEYSQEVAVI